MPLIGTQNPWISAAGGANAGANELAQTLLRVPLLRQQMQQGALQNQLLQGQVAYQPKQQAAQLGQLQARAGAETARGNYYGAQAGLATEKTDVMKGQQTGLEAIQATLAKVAQGDTSPQTQAELVTGMSKLDPKIMGKIVDNILQARGAMNPQLMGSGQAQLAAILGSKQTGQNIPANGVNVPFSGGGMIPGLVKTNPGQQVQDPNSGDMLANNTNAMSGSKSSALMSTVYRSIASANPDKDPAWITAATQQAVAALTGQGTNPSPGVGISDLSSPKGQDTPSGVDGVYNPQTGKIEPPSNRIKGASDVAPITQPTTEAPSPVQQDPMDAMSFMKTIQQAIKARTASGVPNQAFQQLAEQIAQRQGPYPSSPALQIGSSVFHHDPSRAYLGPLMGQEGVMKSVTPQIVWDYLAKLPPDQQTAIFRAALQGVVPNSNTIKPVALPTPQSQIATTFE